MTTTQITLTSIEANVIVALLDAEFDRTIKAAPTDVTQASLTGIAVLIAKIDQANADAITREFMGENGIWEDTRKARMEAAWAAIEQEA